MVDSEPGLAPDLAFAELEVLRGGSWNNPAENLRAAERNRNPAGNRNDDIGFRLAAAPPNTRALPTLTISDRPPCRSYPETLDGLEFSWLARSRRLWPSVRAGRPAEIGW